MNGNGQEMEGALGEFHAKPVTWINRLFNISSSQWPRVTECWFITLFFKIGSAIGWTILTAAFVAHFGISFLPTLFVINAICIILSSFFFEKLIVRMKREVLMILMVLVAAIGLFFASFLYERSLFAFFTLVILSESIFLAQFNVFIPILVGDRFTPLESPKTFPFVESADTIGGIIGGVLVGIFAGRFPIPLFLYIWIACLVCIILVFLITSSVRICLPPLPFRIASSFAEKPKNQIKEIAKAIKLIPFLRALIIIVLLQWVFMNFLEFQYTKAVGQTVTNQTEQTIAHVDPGLIKAAVLNSSDQPNVLNNEAKDIKRSLSETQQITLTQKLGTLKGIFSASALIVQIIFASRFITSFGVVGSLLMHPIIMLMSLVGMFLKFGFTSSVIAKTNFEITNVVHKNAYFTSHYAFPKWIRDQAAQFLEGVIRPMGTIVSMLFILGLQFIFSGKDLTMWIHIMMFCIMAVILLTTLKLQPKYTNVSRDQLFADLPYPEKLNAIEILAQRGHSNASTILMQKFHEMKNKTADESPFVRAKLISAIGELNDSGSLPEILDTLYDSDPDVRIEAAHALLNFRGIGEKFYSQAFSRFRIIETLKDVFRQEKYPSIRNAIIRVFAILREPDTASFLLNLLKEDSPEVRADCIYTLGLFRDPSAAYYILPYMSDKSAIVKANAFVALWQFPKYKKTIEDKLNLMLKSEEPAVLRASVFALGEMQIPRNAILLKLLKSDDKDIRFEAAYALLKCGDPHGFVFFLNCLHDLDAEEFGHLRRFIYRLKPKIKEMIENMLVHYISEELRKLTNIYSGKSLEDMEYGVLERLKRLYMLVGQHEELYTIEYALKNKIPAHA